ncbi:MAG: hypothetical protein P3T54_00050 [Dehalogenimonas sp.]|nr:hypothetical protein [Dehalogenimonas sp.]
MKLIQRILGKRQTVNTGVLSITRNGRLMVTNNTVPDDLELEREYDRQEAFRVWLDEHKN